MKTPKCCVLLQVSHFLRSNKIPDKEPLSPTFLSSFTFLFLRRPLDLSCILLLSVPGLPWNVVLFLYNSALSIRYYSHVDVCRRCSYVFKTATALPLHVSASWVRSTATYKKQHIPRSCVRSDARSPERSVHVSFYIPSLSTRVMYRIARQSVWDVCPGRSNRPIIWTS